MSTMIIAGHRVRPGLVPAAFALLAAAVAIAVAASAPWWLVAAGVIGPDLAFLAALGDRPDAPGLMPRRAVRPYNLVHQPAGPLLLLAAAAGTLSAPVAVLALAWLGHLVWDRAVGYTLRRPDGSPRTPAG